MSTASVASARHPYPLMRWVGLAWLMIYVPAYLIAYGPKSFLFLCNLGVLITAVGFWRGSRLLVSSQAIAAPVIGIPWAIDALWRLVTGNFLYGATAYMWDPQFPLFTRMLSLYHIVWPVVVIGCVVSRGYDRRGWRLQSGIAAVMILLSRALATPSENVNFAYRDPFFGVAFEPAILHLAIVCTVLAGAGYGLTHLALLRLSSVSQDAVSRARAKAASKQR